MAVTSPADPRLPAMPDPNVQAAALNQAIALCTSQGWRLQTISPSTAVMVSGGKGGVNHVVNAILSLLTCGLWLIVWLALIVLTPNDQERSLLITVDPYGNVTYTPGQ